MKIRVLNDFMIAEIKQAKEENWPWWFEDSAPSPDPAELAKFLILVPYPWDDEDFMGVDHV
jgi:hypothetical protein